MNNAWSADKKAFTQIYGATDLDASVLLMESYGFIDPNNHKYISTVEAKRVIKKRPVISL